MNENDIIKTACIRAGDYTNKSSEQLAMEVVEITTLKRMAILSFFQQIIEAGGVRSELTPLYTQSEFIKDLKANLLKGDLEVIQTLVSVAEDLATTMSQVTKDAIATVIVANSLRLVDVVAAEINLTAPEAVTASMVDQALGR